MIPMEPERLGVLSRAVEGELGCVGAAEKLGRSQRHPNRIRDRCEGDGDEGLIPRSWLRTLSDDRNTLVFPERLYFLLLNLKSLIGLEDS